MEVLRHFIRDHRRIAILLAALTLAMKALVPAGYMVGQHFKVLTVEICADTIGAHITKQIVVPASDGAEKSVQDHGKADGACPFGALGMAALTGADAALLTLALAFILTLGFVAVYPPRPGRTLHLRPPLRGPPVLG